MKSLTNCENPSSNPVQRTFFGFLIAACVKVVRKAASGMKIVPKAGHEFTQVKINQ
jgi:hypothetical protein